MFKKQSEVIEVPKKTKKPRVKKPAKDLKAKGLIIKTLLLPASAALIVTALIYVFLDQKQEDKLLQTTVVVAKEEITKNTYITSEEIDEYFYTLEIDSTKISDNTYTALSDLPDGFYVLDSLSPKQQVYTSNIAESDELLDKYKTSEVFSTSIYVSAFYNALNGTIRKGDIIDIYAINPATGSLELYAEDVYVAAAYSSSGEEIENDGIAVSFSIYVTADEIEKVNDAITDGGVHLFLAK